MKKKIKLPKLVLVTEAVRQLDTKQLAQVAGGGSSQYNACHCNATTAQ